MFKVSAVKGTTSHAVLPNRCPNQTLMDVRLSVLRSSLPGNLCGVLPFLTSLKHTGVSGSRTAIKVVLASGQFQSPTEKFLLEQGSCVTSVHLPFRLFCVDDLLALLESVSAPFWSGLLVVLLLILRVLFIMARGQHVPPCHADRLVLRL